MDEYADLREDRASEILYQMGPQLAFWSSIANLHPARTPKTLELLDTVVRFAIFVEMRFKHALAVPRPIDYSPQVQPMIQTPGHGSLPSGHGTQAYIVSNVLCALRGQPETSVFGQQLMRQAYRVTINRTIAGVHFPVDHIAGRLLGTTLAEYFVHRCKYVPGKRGGFTPRTFNGPKFNGHLDFEPHQPLNTAELLAWCNKKVPDKDPEAVRRDDFGWIEWCDTESGVEGSEILAWIWNQAAAEWDNRALATTRLPGT
jgi:hypothetical protein